MQEIIIKAVENERGRFMPMKTIVIYTSQTGFTKRYAEWIAEATQADCFDLSAAKKKDLATYEAIIFVVGLVRAVSVKLVGLREI